MSVVRVQTAKNKSLLCCIQSIKVFRLNSFCVCQCVSFAFHLFPVLTKRTSVRALQLYHVRNTRTPQLLQTHNFSLSPAQSFLFAFLRTLPFVPIIYFRMTVDRRRYYSDIFPRINLLDETIYSTLYIANQPLYSRQW